MMLIYRFEFWRKFSVSSFLSHPNSRWDIFLCNFPQDAKDDALVQVFLIADPSEVTWASWSLGKSDISSSTASFVCLLKLVDSGKKARCQSWLIIRKERCLCTKFCSSWWILDSHRCPAIQLEKICYLHGSQYRQALHLQSGAQERERVVET